MANFFANDSEVLSIKSIYDDKLKNFHINIDTDPVHIFEN